MSSKSLVVLLAVMASVAVAIPARAADDSTVAAINGSPLTIYLGGRSQLQAIRTGDISDIFFAPSQQLGDAGFFLAFPGTQTVVPNNSVFGFNGSAGPTLSNRYTEVSQAPATGDGSAANPFTQVTTYTAGAQVSVAQTTTYVNGASQFDVRWVVTNNASTPISYKALVAADFYFEGSDRGTGIFTLGPPRFVGGTNADTGRSGGFVEVLGASAAWSHYQTLQWPDVWTSHIQTAAASTAATFDDTILGQPADNAGGVEWDDAIATPLAAGGSSTYELVVRSAAPAALQFDKSNAGSPQHVPITFVATAKDTAGVPFAGKPLRFTATGVNPGTGVATIDANGNAAITDPGTNAGADTIVAYVDLNNDSSREANEPQASALATFIDNIPPSCAVKVTGDRPGGGGAGKPLVITVNCDSPATVTTTSSLTITPRAVSHAVIAKKKKKAKKIVVKLPKTTAVVQPGQLVPVDVKISKTIAKKYSGAKVTAKVVVTAVDAAGNHATKTASRTVKLRVYKAPKKKKKH